MHAYVSPCFLCFTAVHANQRDIIFLLDGSVNVGRTNFPYVRDFVTNVVNSLDVGSDRIRVGLVQFSDSPVTEFSLDTYHTKADLLTHLRRLQLQGGSGLNTGSALSYVHAHHFTEAGGSRIRDRVPQLLLLLTAGQSEDAFLPAANALAREGVLTFCVGAHGADKAELEQIAFNPSLVYLMDEFSSLSALPQQLIQPLTTYVSGGVEEVPLAQPGNAPPPRGAPTHTSRQAAGPAPAQERGEARGLCRPPLVGVFEGVGDTVPARSRCLSEGCWSLKAGLENVVHAPRILPRPLFSSCEGAGRRPRCECRGADRDGFPTTLEDSPLEITALFLN